MRRLIKAILKSISFTLGLVAFFSVTSFTFPLLSEPKNRFSPITGLIEAYNEVEKTALLIVPDEVEKIVERLARVLSEG